MPPLGKFRNHRFVTLSHVFGPNLKGQFIRSVGRLKEPLSAVLILFVLRPRRPEPDTSENGVINL
jgi:hypothetical protein